MSHLLLDHISSAYRTLRHNRGRTLLTVLGVTIGIASVTCILALADGVSQVIGGQVEKFDGRLIIVRPGGQIRDPNALISPASLQSFSTSTLTEPDVQALGELEHVETIVPLMTIEGSVKSVVNNLEHNVVLATTHDFSAITDVSMKSGQFLDEKTDNTTAVIGEDLALAVFDTDRPIGQQFTMRGQTFTVIGVIARSDHPINYNNIDLNQAIVINFDQGKLFHQGRTQIQQINILATNMTDVPKLTNDIRSKLTELHQGENDFTITSGDEISRPSNDLLLAITAVMTAIAAISLVVGGIGIMNILLVGVAERTREIGIRKAVGASNGSIITQFLIESLMISLLGAFFGYLLGYVIAFIISTTLYFAPALTWLPAAAAFGVAIVVGVIFGSFPAIKAARKDTIESLRQYH